MGFWKQLIGLEELPTYRGHVPPRPIPPPPERPKGDISEPVLSIIQTLKNGEWSHRTIAGYSAEYAIFKHEWFGNELTTYCFRRYGDKDKIECQSEWMTQAEKEAVGSVCWQIYQGRVKWEKEQSLAKQRESFMCLVKEIND